MKRGQAAIEYMIIIGVSFIILMTFLYMISEEVSSIAAKKEFYVINDIGFSIQNEIFTASTVEDGYFREFNVPMPEKNVQYSVNILYNYLTIKSTRYQMNAEFPLPNVTGNIQTGINNVSKKGGIIYLNQ